MHSTLDGAMPQSFWVEAATNTYGDSFHDRFPEEEHSSSCSYSILSGENFQCFKKTCTCTCILIHTINNIYTYIFVS